MHQRSISCVIALFAAAVACGGDAITVTSPNATVDTIVSVDGAGHLVYQVTRNGAAIVEPSPLGVTVNEVDLGSGVTIASRKRFGRRRAYTRRGVHAKATDEFTGAVVDVTHAASTTRYALEVRVFDDGVAFRYTIPGQGVRTVSGERTAFRLPAGATVWLQRNTANYEAEYEKHAVEAVPAGLHMGPPLVVELPAGRGFAAISEAALYEYSGMTLRAEGGPARLFHAAFQDDDSWPLEGAITTPWRAVMIAPTLNGLVNCDLIASLAPPPAPELAEAAWIKPGRALWHWWSGKIGNWDSVAYPRQKAWIDRAAQLGFEYYLVDAGWELTWKEPGKDAWALVTELTTYAKEKGVGIFLWKRWRDGTTEGVLMEGIEKPAARKEFFRQCREAGVAGIKIDFMDSESLERIRFYTAVLKETAEAKLLVNFHGANKPTGEAITYPNEVSREGIKGLEYNKWSALPPAHYASLPFTRFLVGHGDFTPCTFNPDMLKGTTFALQLACAVCYTSPVMHWADRPERYLESPAVDVIKAIPATWDETRVLTGSAIGDLAVMARRSGTTWFVGIINGGGKREYALRLPFLRGYSYDSVQLADNPERPDALVRTEAVVRPAQMITVRMNAGGGYVGMFTPALGRRIQTPAGRRIRPATPKSIRPATPGSK
jgi:alpha-glucosidase